MAADAERRGDGERPEHVRGVEVAEHDPVADIGPGGLADEVEGEALRRGESHLGRHHQRRAVDQRDEAEGELVRSPRAALLSRSPGRSICIGPYLRSCAAMTSPAATSATRRLSFIAVLRRSA